MLILLLLLAAGYAILVHARRHISLPGRIGMVLGMIGGLLLGVFFLAQGIRIPILPIVSAVMGACYVGAEFHRRFKDTFGK